MLEKQDIGARVRFARWLDGIRGQPVEWDLEPYAPVLRAIDAAAAELDLARQTDSLLRDRSMRLKERAAAAQDLEPFLAEAFALVREASSRAIGLTHFDVQLVAGTALYRQRFVEMQTGEGKTAVAVLPAYLAALRGDGVHVLTFNDYLARRDARWMGPVYELLGLTAGHVVESSSPADRKKAYAADVTYVTAREAGFDYLRQHLARSAADAVLRPFCWAVVDEADSILIDEARIPLVVAGRDDHRVDESRVEFASIAQAMRKDVHFGLDENERNVFLTDEGALLLQERLGCGSPFDDGNHDILTQMTQALHAQALLARNVDYIVRGGRVDVVDEFTGRVVRDRQWPDGLHSAVEAKEHLAIRDEGRVLGSMTMQDLASLYPNICGMSGTIVPAEEELCHFYGGRKTLIVPPHRPCIRVDHPDVVFTHGQAKYVAVVREIGEAHRSGRPVLAGTSSVQESERLAELLGQAGIECNVLNARNDEQEAGIVAEAGARGAVTVSTNMAGRGTDIRLGGADGRDREIVVAGEASTSSAPAASRAAASTIS